MGQSSSWDRAGAGGGAPSLRGLRRREGAPALARALARRPSARFFPSPASSAGGAAAVFAKEAARGRQASLINTRAPLSPALPPRGARPHGNRGKTEAYISARGGALLNPFRRGRAGVLGGARGLRAFSAGLVDAAALVVMAIDARGVWFGGVKFRC